MVSILIIDNAVYTIKIRKLYSERFSCARLVGTTKPHLIRSRRRTKSTTSVFWTNASNPPQSSGQSTHNSLTWTHRSLRVETLNLLIVCIYIFSSPYTPIWNEYLKFLLSKYIRFCLERTERYIFFSPQPYRTIFLFYLLIFFFFRRNTTFFVVVVLLQQRTASFSGERTNINISSCTKTRFRSNRSINIYYIDVEIFSRFFFHFIFYTFYYIYTFNWL